MTKRILWACLEVSLTLLLVSSQCCDACRVRNRTQHKPNKYEKMPAFDPNDKNLLDYTLIDSRTTCDHVAEPNKTLIYCFNEGKCNSKFIYLNETHYEKIAFCICSPCYDGELCREYICLYDYIEAKAGIIFLACTVILIVVVLIFFVRRKRLQAKDRTIEENSSLAEEAGRRVEIMNKKRDEQEKSATEANSLLTPSSHDLKS